MLSVDNVAIYSVAEWQNSCPPKGGDKQWKDGYSAKESAKAWFREGHLTLPRELGSLLESHEDFMRFLPDTMRSDEVKAWLDITGEVQCARDARWDEPSDDDARLALEALARELQ